MIEEFLEFSLKKNAVMVQLKMRQKSAFHYLHTFQTESLHTQ